jgi:hypothetical protein
MKREYVKIDEEQVRIDYPEVFERYEDTHIVTPRKGVRVDLRKLKPNESVVWGDGKTFHFKLTKR